MNKLIINSIFVITCLFTTQLTAHHSFAIYDFETQVPFDGIVETLKFRNPHIQMTLKVINENGEEVIVDFIEGAPANMMVRNGIKPDQMKQGSKVHAVGSPLIEDPSKFFLRSIRTEDGLEYSN